MFQNERFQSASKGSGANDVQSQMWMPGKSLSKGRDQKMISLALDQSAQSAVERSLSGGDVTQVEVLTEMKKADLALRMMIQVHNKIFDAYNEIKQMQM